MTETAKKPFVYEGSGSAIDAYLKPQKENAPVQNENWGKFKKDNKQHLTILSILRQAQWTVTKPNYGEVADLERFSNWLKSDKSPVKKPLLKMTPDEVSKVIVAIGGIVSSKYKKR